MCFLFCKVLFCSLKNTYTHTHIYIYIYITFNSRKSHKWGFETKIITQIVYDTINISHTDKNNYYLKRKSLWIKSSAKYRNVNVNIINK